MRVLKKVKNVKSKLSFLHSKATNPLFYRSKRNQLIIKV